MEIDFMGTPLFQTKIQGLPLLQIHVVAKRFQSYPTIHSFLKRLPDNRAEKSFDWLKGDQGWLTAGESSSILINAKLPVKTNLHINPPGINMVSSARTKIEQWDVQMLTSKSVDGIFYSPFQS